MESLFSLCVRYVSNSNISNLNKTINQICYDKFLDYKIEEGFDNWKDKMKLTKIELNIKEMDVSYDMHFDEPCHFIFIKYRNNPEELYQDDYDELYQDDYDELYQDDYDELYRDDYDELYRDEYDSSLYNIYYDIAKSRGLIDNC
jgi:hypothetical protein